MRVTDLTLPEWAFLDAHDGSKNHLSGRTVILHARSASVIEIFDRDDVVLDDHVVSFKFSNINKFGLKEQMIAALHYCATLDAQADKEMIKNEILKPCATWYCEYCDAEDKNILDNV